MPQHTSTSGYAKLDFVGEEEGERKSQCVLFTKPESFSCLFVAPSAPTTERRRVVGMLALAVLPTPVLGRDG